jgi:lantibiotic modifying enzyme
MRTLVIKGFTNAYLAVAQDETLRSEFAARVSGFADMRSRLVFRATRAYYHLLARSLRRDLLGTTEGRRDFIARDLASAAPTTAAYEILLPMLSSELMALQELDVPYFITSTTGTAISDGHGEMVQSAVVAPALDVAQRRLEELGSSHLVNMQDQLASALR